MKLGFSDKWYEEKRKYDERVKKLENLYHMAQIGEISYGEYLKALYDGEEKEEEV